jgi:bis(5'-nucleosyl)-tetraphosphatase (symmetrical)
MHSRERQLTTYLIGDIQGCADAFDALLDTLRFDPAGDRLIVLGDLVNRGPRSLASIERLIALGDSAQCLLGNHDLHLLAVAAGIRKAHRTDTLDDILESPRRAELLDWVRRRPLALMEHGWLLVHAGVLPQWTAPQTLQLAGEVERRLRGADYVDFLRVMYGNEPDTWDDALAGDDRLRLVVNTLTRARFVDAAGPRGSRLDFRNKGAAAAPGLLPWFTVPGRRTAGTPIAFGHWSTLGLHWGDATLCLDTGCLWGGALTAAVLPPAGQRWLDLVQIPCARRLEPMTD